MTGARTLISEPVDAQDYERMKPYAIVIQWSELDQLFLATAPDLSGCTTAGATPAEAAANAEEAIAATLASLADSGVPFPPARFDATNAEAEDYAEASAD